MPQPRPMLQKYLIADLPKAEALLPYLRRLDENRWYSNFGPLANELELKMRRLLKDIDQHPEYGSLCLTTIATGHHAIEVGLRMLNLPKGGKILVPAITYPSCPFAVQGAGCEAVLSDVDPDTWTLTPEIARRVAATTKLVAVMPVAIYGVVVPVEEWDAFQKDTGIPVIIDAAAAFESQQIPAHGLVAHSLHATKPFGIGEGGLLVCRDQSIINRTRTYSHFGTINRIAHFDGSNTKMSEFHAAVGLAQFDRWALIKSTRHKVLSYYQKHLKPLENALSLQKDLESTIPSSLMLYLNAPLAADVIASGTEESIAFHKAYLPPLYHHPQFRDLSIANAEGKILTGDIAALKKSAHMIESENMLTHIVGVPFHPFMEEEDVVYVADALRRKVAL